jgi:hypothetical protein
MRDFHAVFEGARSVRAAPLFSSLGYPDPGLLRPSLIDVGYFSRRHFDRAAMPIAQRFRPCLFLNVRLF